jgi:glycosyltransferase involved in cell wall biosynthesis
MRIAFDDQVFCMVPHGGVARYFVRLAEQLIAREQKVGIFAPLHRNRYAEALPSGVVHGWALRRYPPKCDRLLMMPLNHVFARLAISHWRPNVVHETYYSRWGSAPRSCPSVITVYDMTSELFSDGVRTRDNISKLKRMAIDRADHVICISENTRRDLMELFGTNDRKISVVHLGFDRFLSNSEANEKLPAQAKPYLLYVGSRAGYKNYSGFVRAVASSKRLKMDFDILAFGGGRFSSSEIALLAELGFQPDQVKQVAGDDKILGHLYDQAAAFVYPSLYEGFGLPPLEAMAHQCAVISSNTSSMPEVIGEAAEFFDPKSIDDMASAIARVVYSSSRIQDLVERGRKRLDLFSWERCADRTLDIYRSM